MGQGTLTHVAKDKKDAIRSRWDRYLGMTAAMTQVPTARARKGMKGQNGRFLLTIKEYVYYSYLLYGHEEADKRLMMYKEKYQLNKDDISQLRQLYNLDIMDFVPF